MQIIKISDYNGYATNESGKLFRAIHISGKWRLSTATNDFYKPWEFVNDKTYNSCVEALNDCENF